jgi:hypothetical protein
MTWLLVIAYCLLALSTTWWICLALSQSDEAERAKRPKVPAQARTVLRGRYIGDGCYNDEGADV